MKCSEGGEPGAQDDGSTVSFMILMWQSVGRVGTFPLRKPLSSNVWLFPRACQMQPVLGGNKDSHRILLKVGLPEVLLWDQICLLPAAAAYPNFTSIPGPSQLVDIIP